MNDSSRTPLARGRSVQQDWRAWLPQEKALAYFKYQQELESPYNMFSVSLNEAIELRRAGSLAMSLQALGMAADICRLFVCPLTAVLCALYDHSKHYGTIPCTAPLDPGNFVGGRFQRSARLSELLSHVLLSQRLQFLQKVSAVQEIVEDLDKDFHASVNELLDVAGMPTDQLWDEVAGNHYDLNTCLRETFVLLKSFLVVLPTIELEAFQEMVESHAHPYEQGAPVRTAAISNRRMAAFAGR